MQLQKLCYGLVPLSKTDDTIMVGKLHLTNKICCNTFRESWKKSNIGFWILKKTSFSIKRVFADFLISFRKPLWLLTMASKISINIEISKVYVSKQWQITLSVKLMSQHHDNVPIILRIIFVFICLMTKPISRSRNVVTYQFSCGSLGRIL